MKTLNGVWAKLRRKGIGSYGILALCSLISVTLITSFAVIMQSRTVQTVLPEGGDSRKMVTMIFVLAIVGCGIFTTYASSLFFKAKSRDMGIFMALGARRSQLKRLLFGDLALVSVGAAVAGMLLGTPLAVGIWQFFRLMVGGAEMAFSIGWSAYLWSLGFCLVTTALTFVMGLRFVGRTNIIDVVNEQRKSEPVRDVKGWYAPVGAVLMVVGALAVTLLPRVFIAAGYASPAWLNLMYLAVLAGVYLLLQYVVVRGFGFGDRYKNIISRSMMKFQGRQTVRNMLVITLLVAAAYFAMFYGPTMRAGGVTAADNYEHDFAFHYRDDETAIPAEADIRAMAAEEGVEITGYTTLPVATLATDGIDIDFNDAGEITREYYELYAEESMIPVSEYNRVTGENVQLAPGGYRYIRSSEAFDSFWFYFRDHETFTNPVTGQALPVTYEGDLTNNTFVQWYLLNDEDFAAISAGLPAEWRETMVLFDVADPAESYNFAKRLRNAIIDASSQNSAVFSNYDRIERQNALAAGEEYFGDIVPEMQVDYDQRDSSNFIAEWKYAPRFRAIDARDTVINSAVYVMLFVFIAIVCFAAVIIIAYTRCVTIAINNRQVYTDLHRLGANRAYLYRSVKGQASKVFLVPALLGSAGIYAYYALMLYANDSAYTPSELSALGTCLAILLALSAVIWLAYRGTLRKVCKMLAL